jgi:hypothetical protein
LSTLLSPCYVFCKEEKEPEALAITALLLVVSHIASGYLVSNKALVLILGNKTPPSSRTLANDIVDPYISVKKNSN